MKINDLSNDSIQAQVVIDYEGTIVGVFAFEDAWLRLWPNEDGYHLCPIEPGDNVYAWLEKEYPGHEVLIDTLHWTHPYHGTVMEC